MTNLPHSYNSPYMPNSYNSPNSSQMSNSSPLSDLPQSTNSPNLSHSSQLPRLTPRSNSNESNQTIYDLLLETNLPSLTYDRVPNAPNTSEQDNIVPHLSNLAKQAFNIVPYLTSLAKLSQNIVPNLPNLARKTQDLPHLTSLARQSQESVTPILPHDLIRQSPNLSRQVVDLIPIINKLPSRHAQLPHLTNLPREAESLLRSDPPPVYQPLSKTPFGPPPEYNSISPQYRARISNSPPPVYVHDHSDQPPPRYMRNCPHILPREPIYPPYRETPYYMRNSYEIYEFLLTNCDVKTRRMFKTSDLYDIPRLPFVHLFYPGCIPHYTLRPGTSVKEAEDLIRPTNVMLKIDVEILNMAPRSKFYEAMIRTQKAVYESPDVPYWTTLDQNVWPAYEKYYKEKMDEPKLSQTETECNPMAAEFVPALELNETENEIMFNPITHKTNLPDDPKLTFNPVSKPFTPINIDQRAQDKDSNLTENSTYKVDQSDTNIEQINQAVPASPVKTENLKKKDDLELTIDMEEGTAGYEVKQMAAQNINTEPEHIKLKDVAEALTPKIDCTKFKVEPQNDFFKRSILCPDERDNIYVEDIIDFNFEHINLFQAIYEPPENFYEPNSEVSNDKTNVFFGQTNIHVDPTIKRINYGLLNYKRKKCEELIHRGASKSRELYSPTYYCYEEDKPRPVISNPITEYDDDLSEMDKVLNDIENTNLGLFSRSSKPKLLVNPKRFTRKYNVLITDTEFLTIDCVRGVNVPGTGINSVPPIEFLPPHSFEGEHDIPEYPEPKNYEDNVDVPSPSSLERGISPKGSEFVDDLEFLLPHPYERDVGSHKDFDVNSLTHIELYPPHPFEVGYIGPNHRPFEMVPVHKNLSKSISEKYDKKVKFEFVDETVKKGKPANSLASIHRPSTSKVDGASLGH